MKFHIKWIVHFLYATINPMQKPTWIVFDVGGVLLDWQRSSAAVADYLGVSHDTLLNTMFSHAPEMNIGAISPQTGWEIILKELNYDPQEVIRQWRHKEFWLPDILQLAKDLHHNEYRLAILTNSWLGLTDETDQSHSCLRN